MSHVICPIPHSVHLTDRVKHQMEEVQPLQFRCYTQENVLSFVHEREER